MANYSYTDFSKGLTDRSAASKLDEEYTKKLLKAENMYLTSAKILETRPGVSDDLEGILPTHALVEDSFEEILDFFQIDDYVVYYGTVNGEILSEEIGTDFEKHRRFILADSQGIFKTIDFINASIKQLWVDSQLIGDVNLTLSEELDDNLSTAGDAVYYNAWGFRYEIKDRTIRIAGTNKLILAHPDLTPDLAETFLQEVLEPPKDIPLIVECYPFANVTNFGVDNFDVANHPDLIPAPYVVRTSLEKLNLNTLLEETLNTDEKINDEDEGSYVYYGFGTSELEKRRHLTKQDWRNAIAGTERPWDGETDTRFQGLADSLEEIKSNLAITLSTAHSTFTTGVEGINVCPDIIFRRDRISDIPVGSKRVYNGRGQNTSWFVSEVDALFGSDKAYQTPQDNFLTAEPDRTDGSNIRNGLGASYATRGVLLAGQYQGSVVQESYCPLLTAPALNNNSVTDVADGVGRQRPYTRSVFVFHLDLDSPVIKEYMDRIKSFYNLYSDTIYDSEDLEDGKIKDDARKINTKIAILGEGQSYNPSEDSNFTDSLTTEVNKLKTVTSNPLGSYSITFNTRTNTNSFLFGRILNFQTTRAFRESGAAAASALEDAKAARDRFELVFTSYVNVRIRQEGGEGTVVEYNVNGGTYGSPDRRFLTRQDRTRITVRQAFQNGVARRRDGGGSYYYEHLPTWERNGVIYTRDTIDSVISNLEAGTGLTERYKGNATTNVAIPSDLGDGSVYSTQDIIDYRGGTDSTAENILTPFSLLYTVFSPANGSTTHRISATRNGVAKNSTFTFSHLQRKSDLNVAYKNYFDMNTLLSDDTDFLENSGLGRRQIEDSPLDPITFAFTSDFGQSVNVTNYQDLGVSPITAATTGFIATEDTTHRIVHTSSAVSRPIVQEDINVGYKPNTLLVYSGATYGVSKNDVIKGFYLEQLGGTAEDRVNEEYTFRKEITGTVDLSSNLRLGLFHTASNTIYCLSFAPIRGERGFTEFTLPESVEIRKIKKIAHDKVVLLTNQGLLRMDFSEPMNPLNDDGSIVPSPYSHDIIGGQNFGIKQLIMPTPIMAITDRGITTNRTITLSEATIGMSGEASGRFKILEYTTGEELHSVEFRRILGEQNVFKIVDWSGQLAIDNLGVNGTRLPVVEIEKDFGHWTIASINLQIQL